MSILGSSDLPSPKAKPKARSSAKPVKERWSDKVNARLAALETPAPQENAYPAVVRRRFDAVESTTDRLARERICVRLGTITVGQVAMSRITDSPFDASYDTGGEDVEIPPTFGSFTSYIIPPRLGYTMEISGTKIKAYSASDTEVTASTDLTSVNPITIIALNPVPADRVVYTSRGPARLLKAEIEVASDLTGDTTDYWTLTLRHRKSGQTTGELVGSAFTTSTHGLTAQDPVTIYDEANGLTMSDGERLALYVSETANAAALEDLVLWLTIQREVR